MNEQMIFNLYSQASKLAKDEIESSKSRVKSYNIITLEKFAELIMKETLRITSASPIMIKTAKKHFGVEE